MFRYIKVNVMQTLNINSRTFERDRVAYIDMVIFCCDVV